MIFIPVSKNQINFEKLNSAKIKCLNTSRGSENVLENFSYEARRSTTLMYYFCITGVFGYTELMNLEYGIHVEWKFFWK